MTSLVRLKREGDRCKRLERELETQRRVRDRIALDLVEAGHTWREVAKAAGFENPYIAQIRGRARAVAR